MEKLRQLRINSCQFGRTRLILQGFIAAPEWATTGTFRGGSYRFFLSSMHNLRHMHGVTFARIAINDGQNESPLTT